MEQITVSVDREVAEAYRCASEDERHKLDVLICLRLREATRPAKALKEVASEIGANAQQRGLTPEILQGILDG